MVQDRHNEYSKNKEKTNLQSKVLMVSTKNIFFKTMKMNIYLLDNIYSSGRETVTKTLGLRIKLDGSIRSQIQFGGPVKTKSCIYMIPSPILSSLHRVSYVLLFLMLLLFCGSSNQRYYGFIF